MVTETRFGIFCSSRVIQNDSVFWYMLFWTSAETDSTNLYRTTTQLISRLNKYPFQHTFVKETARTTKARKQTYAHIIMCWSHWWLSRRWSWTGKISWASRQSFHNLRHGISAERAKLWQHQRHQQGNLSKRADSQKLQVPGLSCIRRGFQAWDTLQDSIDDSSLDNVETSL